MNLKRTRLFPERNKHISNLISRNLDKKKLLPIENRLDPNLLKCYGQLAQACCHFLSTPVHQAVNQFGISPSMWTDHGPDHAFSVVKIINDLWKNIKILRDLKKYEIFILLCSAWVHDLGMFIQFPHLTKEEIRRYHGRVSGNLLNLLDILFETEIETYHLGLIKKLSVPISLVAAAHQNECHLSNLNEREISPPNSKKHKIRLDILGAILRFADALHIDRNRADKKFFIFLKELYGFPSDSSIFEWNVNRCVTNVEIGNNKVITFALQLDDSLKSQIIEYKLTGKDFESPSAKEKFKELTAERISQLPFLIKNYIQYYLAEHIESIEDRSVSEITIRLKEELKKWKILFNVDDDNKPTPDFKKIINDRKNYSRILKKNKMKYWMSSVDEDPKVFEQMTKMRSIIAEKFRSKDIFLFLLDQEYGKLRLWSGEKFYKDYVRSPSGAEDDSITQFCNDLRKVMIPIKCGIIGYIAWLGKSEFIQDERFDPRASYIKFDEKLDLRNLFIENLNFKGNFYGVLLLNFLELENFTSFKKQLKSKTTSGLLKFLDIHEEFTSLIKILNAHRVN